MSANLLKKTRHKVVLTCIVFYQFESVKAFEKAKEYDRKRFIDRKGGTTHYLDNLHKTNTCKLYSQLILLCLNFVD